jgi:hypothetical protein
VVRGDVERDADREHQADELERPPFVQQRRRERRGEHGEDGGGEAALEPSSQRVRHEVTFLAKRRAAYFIPIRVSAAG